MPSLTSPDRYTAVAIALHWAIASFILFNLCTGFFMEGLSHAWKDIVVPLHASSGLTVLLLSVARVLWRLTHRPPPFDPILSAAERRGARTVHMLLYTLMIIMPLLGWSIQSASPRMVPNYYFFLVQVPKNPAIAHMAKPSKVMLHEQFVLLHSIGAFILLALLLLHVAGALKHEFLDRRPQLARMGF